MNNKLHLSKSPLIDTVVEVRFSSNLPAQVLAGLLYSKLGMHGYYEFEELPISQLPKEIRDNNENLKYAAYYRIKKEAFWVGVGPNVIAITCISTDSQYKGWKTYKNEIATVLNELENLGAVQEISRVSVRYINLFRNDTIFDGISLEIKTPNQNKLKQKRNISFAYDAGDSEIEVVFATNATVANQQISMTGTILDINSYSEKSVDFNKIPSIVEEEHNNVENTFINLLKKPFLENLK